MAENRQQAVDLSEVPLAACNADVSPAPRDVNSNRENSQQADTAQRRADPRVAPADPDGVAVRIHAAGTAELSAISLNSRGGSGRIVNLSCGGMAVRLEGEDRLRFGVGQSCFYTFSLPGTEMPLVLLGEFRHAREVPEGDASVLGVRFLVWPDALEYCGRIASVWRYIANTGRTELTADKNGAVAA